MLAIVGIILMALGLLSGAVLVLATMGLMAATPGITLWMAFPALYILGYVSMAMQAQTAQMRLATMATSGVLLVLALASVIVLVLSAASLMPEPASTGALWYVMIVGLALGSFGAASFGKSDEPKVST